MLRLIEQAKRRHSLEGAKNYRSYGALNRSDNHHCSMRGNARKARPSAIALSSSRWASADDGEINRRARASLPREPQVAM